MGLCEALSKALFQMVCILIYTPPSTCKPELPISTVNLVPCTSHKERAMTVTFQMVGEAITTNGLVCGPSGFSD